MSRNSRNTYALRRPGRRTAVAAGLVLALGLGVSAQAVAHAAVPAAPAKASAKASAEVRSISGFNGDVVTQVADFYGAYIDAKDAPRGPDKALAKALRAHYLTPAFAKKLTAWEKKNKADGLLRAQNVPTRWTVSEGSKGLEVVVTLTFGGAGESPTTKTRFVVELEPVDGIKGIRTTSTAPAKASAAVRSVSGRTGDSVTQVADFYGAYVDAKDAPRGPDKALAKALRAHYLTPTLAKKLTAWEKKNKMDGVLRARNVPVDWTVTGDGESREIAVTHSFGGGESPTTTTHLVVKADAFKGVTDIRTTSAR
ncbi:hypothetical protein [Streptomyces sp. NBC_00481]|uniref:hypothetical protein n=1 Tax=Streptomyces sp. NBC_00481 TaxID=2975755 RepID=UPI002DDC48F0|nr:hypothetical protein [Streptomyces sp. NBC_00481]